LAENDHDRDTPLFLNWDHEPHWEALQKEYAVDETGASMLLSLSTANGKVSYSRNWNFYSRVKSGKHGLYTFTNVTRAADYLASAGLVDHFKAPKQAPIPGRRGFQSTLEALPETLAFVRSVIRNSGGLTPLPPLQEIILRDERKAHKAFPRDAGLSRMCKAVQKINEGLISARIDGAPVGLMMRIFNENLSRGGRFYSAGGGWQSMKQDMRSQIQIGGEPVVEIDYKAIHPAMLYAGVGASMPRDCYDLAPWPRSLVKKALLVMLNARNEGQARAAILHSKEMEEIEDRPASVRKLMADIKRFHAPIASYFHSDAGAWLMRKDSDLAQMVMLSMLNKGVVILPVHDSFLVPASKADELEKVMLEESERLLKVAISVERKKTNPNNRLMQ
jgi:hypothetical protein